MRPLPACAVLAATLLASACGGGGGGGGGAAPGGPALVIHGRLVTRGAALPALDGVRVALAQTGDECVTGADGAFAFETDGLSRARLRFSDPAAPRPARFDERDDPPVDVDRPVDPCADGGPAGPFPWFEEDDVDLGDVAGAAEIRLEVELDAGVVTALRTRRESFSGVDRVGVGSLAPLVAGPAGILRLHVGPSDVSVWVDLEGLAKGEDYQVLLSHPLAGPAEVVPFTTTLCGTRRLALVFALGDPPPPESVLVVRRAGGVDVALGPLPGLGVSLP